MAKNKSGLSMIITGISLILLAFSAACYNHFSTVKAEETIQSTLTKLENFIPGAGTQFFIQGTNEPLEEYNYNNIPEYDINGHSYIGTLKLESLNLTLPIISHCSSENLDIAPCKCQSSEGLIIEGKSYPSYFGKIDLLSPGDKITFADTLGKRYYYEVLQSKVVSKNQKLKNLVPNQELVLLKSTQFGFKKLAVFCEKI